MSVGALIPLEIWHFLLDGGPSGGIKQTPGYHIFAW